MCIKWQHTVYGVPAPHRAKMKWQIKEKRNKSSLTPLVFPFCPLLERKLHNLKPWKYSFTTPGLMLKYKERENKKEFRENNQREGERDKMKLKKVKKRLSEVERITQSFIQIKKCACLKKMKKKKKHAETWYRIVPTCIKCCLTMRSSSTSEYALECAAVGRKWLQRKTVKLEDALWQKNTRWCMKTVVRVRVGTLCAHYQSKVWTNVLFQCFFSLFLILYINTPRHPM